MKIMEIDFQDYQLSSQLHGHQHDVRRICVCDNAGIATSSSDKTVMFWRIDPRNKNRCVESKVLVGHTSFVGPLVWIPRNQEFPEGGIVSGGMDTLVCVWDLKTADRVQVLRGHAMQVTGIALDNGDIVSSSIDCTLKRWRNGKAVESWNAHNTAVQAVIKLPSGELATGSSDSTLKVWKGKTCAHTFVGHTDTVRGLAVMSNLGILSASHDGSVRLWALTGEVLVEMVGHTAIVYSVDSHISGIVASGSEDCLAKIWKDGFCVQTIEHPGCVWDVKFLENGDLVTACSDGVVRTWTTNQDRAAEASVRESYISQLSDYKTSRKRVEGLKLEELPGLHDLQVPGTSDGQTKVVREGDNGVAYSWNMREHKWKKIGEVGDRAEDGITRYVLDGREYDYVFGVDIGDGEPMRKLPYNRSDNPYETADKWLLKENLPLSYLQQIVNFILENTGQKTVPKTVSFDPSFCDPYTGANAYVPGKTSYQNGNTCKPAFKHIPKKGFLVFDTAQFDGILKKVSEFNSTLLSDQDRRQLSLTELESSRLNAVVKILKDTSYYHSSTFTDGDIGLLFKLLNSWPLSMVFPVIDILRMIILHADGAAKLLVLINCPGDALLETIKKATVKPGTPANILTGLRAVTNLFKNSCFHPWLHNHRRKILDAFSGFYSSSSKHVQLAYSTLILNYAVLLTEKKDEEGESQVLSIALEISESENADVDARFRALVAVGSLMLHGVVKRTALDFEVESIAKAAKASKEAKLAEVGADIEHLAQRT